MRRRYDVQCMDAVKVPMGQYPSSVRDCNVGLDFASALQFGHGLWEAHADLASKIVLLSISRLYLFFFCKYVSIEA